MHDSSKYSKGNNSFNCGEFGANSIIFKGFGEAQAMSYWSLPLFCRENGQQGPPLALMEPQSPLREPIIKLIFTYCQNSNGPFPWMRYWCPVNHDEFVRNFPYASKYPPTDAQSHTHNDTINGTLWCGIKMAICFGQKWMNNSTSSFFCLWLWRWRWRL